MAQPSHPTPSVSVISTFLNAEDFLAECVESVLGQTFDDFELLLVDDGSTDGSTAIAKDYADRYPDRVRYLEHPDHRNRGMCASRNVALKASQGDFVAVIDSDDCWRPTKLSDQIAILKAMPDVDAVCGSVNFWRCHDGGVDEIVVSGHALNRPIAPPEALLHVYPLGRADPPCPSDLLIRRTVIEAIGGYEESFTGPLELYEDQAFLAKFYLQATIYFSDKIWLDYRVHDRSCTSTVVCNGLGPSVRGHCLEWIEKRIATTPYRHDPRVRWALFRALRPYRYPRISKFGSRAKALVRGFVTSPAQA